MLLIILGYFLLPSLTEEANKAFTCSPGPLTATCDERKVILIERVLRGSYTGAFNGSHCKYQVGDSTETDDGNAKEVWKACNLQNTCSVPFIRSGNIYLDMDYECVYKSNIDMLDICNNGSGTRLVEKHGYIHSPCYPNVSTWTESTNVHCQCSGTFQPAVEAKDIRISVFHAFQENQSLEIRWHAITSTNDNTMTFRSNSPSYKSEKRDTDSFHLKFYSSYRGSDWDRGFWLEFKANATFEFNCSNRDVKPPTCQKPIPPPPTTTKTPTTKTPATITRSTPTTAKVPESTTTSSSTGGGLPGVNTTALSINSPADTAVAIAVGTTIPLIVIAAIVTAVVIIIRKRRQPPEPKTESNGGLALYGASVECNGSFVNQSYDPESREHTAAPEEETEIIEDDPLSIYSLANEGKVQLEFGNPRSGIGEDLVPPHGNAHVDHATNSAVPSSEPKPSVKPKPAPRKIDSKKDDPSRDSEEGEGLAGALYSSVQKDDGGQAPEEDSASENHGFKTGSPVARLKSDSQMDTGSRESQDGDPFDLYAVVEMEGRRGWVGSEEKENAGEDSAAKVIGGGGAGAEVECGPTDLYTEVNKGAKRKGRQEKPIVDISCEGVKESQTDDLYAQVDKTAKPKKPEVPIKRNIGGALDASSRVNDASSGDVYAQVLKGKKTTPPRGEVSKCENADLFSSVDDVVFERLDNEGEEYSEGELYGPVDDDGGHGYECAGGRGYDSGDPDYGEVGGIQDGGPMEPDDDTYDHATYGHKSTVRQSGKGPPAPFEPPDDTYDHIASGLAKDPNIQEDKKSLSDPSDTDV